MKFGALVLRLNKPHDAIQPPTPPAEGTAHAAEDSPAARLRGHHRPVDCRRIGPWHTVFAGRGRLVNDAHPTSEPTERRGQGGFVPGFDRVVAGPLVLKRLYDVTEGRPSVRIGN